MYTSPNSAESMPHTGQPAIAILASHAKWRKLNRFYLLKTSQSKPKGSKCGQENCPFCSYNSRENNEG